MSERDQQIIDFTKRGLSARKIKERLGLDITPRSINRIQTRELGPIPENKNSALYDIDSNMLPYVEWCLDQLGRDKTTCSICGDFNIKCDLHHTKYEGATIYDLMYVCRSCNLSRANTGLA